MNTIDQAILDGLSIIEDLFKSPHFPTVFRAEMEKYEIIPPGEIDGTINDIEAKTVPAYLEGIAAARSFIGSPEYEEICRLFPDAGYWFFKNFSLAAPVQYLIVADMFLPWLKDIAPAAESLLKKYDPKWKPGSIPFSDFMPDLTEKNPSAPLFDFVNSASGINISPPRTPPSERSQSLHRMMSKAAGANTMRVVASPVVSHLGELFQHPGEVHSVLLRKGVKETSKHKGVPQLEQTVVIDIPEDAPACRKFDEFPLAVFDAVNTIYAESLRDFKAGNTPDLPPELSSADLVPVLHDMPTVVFSIRRLWKTMNGEKSKADKRSGESVTDHIGDAITNRIIDVLDLASKADITQDRTDYIRENKRLSGKFRSGYSKDKIFHLREICLENYDGTRTNIYQLLSPPVLLTQAYEAGHAVNVPIPVYKIMKVEGGKVTKSKYSSNEFRTSVKSYLIRRIVQIQRGAKSCNIRMDTLYTRCGIPTNDRKKKERARDFAIACLDYWKAMDLNKEYAGGASAKRIPWIKGYTPNYVKHGSQTVLESITIRPAPIDTDCLPEAAEDAL